MVYDALGLAKLLDFGFKLVVLDMKYKKLSYDINFSLAKEGSICIV